MHLISIQAVPRSESPIPLGFDINHCHHYISFHITNPEGHEVPAKYVKVKMTSNPFAYGMLSSASPIFKGFVHAAPVLNINNTPTLHNHNLQSLQANYSSATQVNNALACIQD